VDAEDKNMTERGDPGKPGHEGEEGKDTGEGGRGGEGGEGGKGGAGQPQGPGGGGGEGGGGGPGARGAQGPPGERGADGPQPRLRWAPAVGYVILALVLGFLIWQTQSLARENQRLIHDVAALDRAQADKSYQDCLARNARAQLALNPRRGLPAWARAARADGSLHTAEFLEGYVKELGQVRLPPCVKPPPMPER
jgi:hypothetical protein